MLFRKMNVALLALCMSASVAVGCGPDENNDNKDDNNKTTADMGVEDSGNGGGGDDAGNGGGGDDAGNGGGGDDAGNGGGGDDAGNGGGGDDAGNGGGGDDAGNGGGDDAGSGGGDDMGEAVCGDGNVTGAETCEGDDCPSSPLECNDNDACTADSIMGSAASCTAQCVNEPVVQCDGGNSDGCCPAGCTEDNDADCGGGGGTPGTAGTECSADTDCGTNGQCLAQEGFEGGYCLTELGCQDDAECGGNDVCLLVDQQTNTTACLDGCQADGDCRTGYTCQDLGQGTNICLPEPVMGSGDAGLACTDDSVCGPGGQCVPETPDNGFVGGYCFGVIGCQDDAECGGDNVCLLVDQQSNTTACIDGCQVNSDCREPDYTCQDIGQGINICLPAPAPITGVTGIACTDASECDAAEECFGADQGFNGGYCSRSCQADMDCPSDSHCGDVGICVADCNANTDCRESEGYLCGDQDGDQADECFPGGTGTGTIGTACDALADCAGGFDGFCITQENAGWQDGYCTLTCAADADCGAGFHCGFADNGSGLCLADCADDTVCRADGYLCFDADGDQIDECASAATGNGVVGDACASAGECAGGTDGLCISDAQGFTDGYCSVQCTVDADCGAGNHCSQQFGVCLDGCQADADCRGLGYYCNDADTDSVTECFPGGANPNAVPGDACDNTADCNAVATAQCIPEDNGFVDGYCIESGCTVGGNDCPGDSFCFDFTDTNDPAAEPFFACVDGCGTDADCRQPDYLCQPFPNAGNGCWVAP